MQDPLLVENTDALHSGNITAKVTLHPSQFPHRPPGHKEGKHYKYKHHKERENKHNKHGEKATYLEERSVKEETSRTRSAKRWSWQGEEQDVEEGMDSFGSAEDWKETDDDVLPPSDERRPPGPPRHPSGPHSGPDGHQGPPPPPHHPGDRYPPFPAPRGPPQPDGKHRHPPPPVLRVRVSSSTGDIHLTYLNHLEEAALVSTVFSDTGKVHVQLAEKYKVSFRLEGTRPS